MKFAIFYFKAVLVICFSKEFKTFETEYFNTAPEEFYKRKFSHKEIFFHEILITAYIY